MKKSTHEWIFKWMQNEVLKKLANLWSLIKATRVVPGGHIDDPSEIAIQKEKRENGNNLKWQQFKMRKFPLLSLWPHQPSHQVNQSGNLNLEMER